MKPSPLLRLTWTLVVAILAAPTGAPVSAQPPSPQDGPTVLAEDDFSSPQLSDGWTLLREDPEGWRLADGTLSIRTKGLLWGGENSQRNVLLHEPLPHEALAAELTVDAGLAMTHAYEHGGLIWYFDDDHWVTLTQLNHVQHETQKIMLVHETEGRGRAWSSVATPYRHQKVELRLERRGSQFIGHYRQPGEDTWVVLGTIDFEHSGSEPRFGIVAGQGDDAALHWVEFDDFRIVALP